MICQFLRLVIESVQAKLELLSSDPFETDLKRAHNFGHTVGHLLETLTEYLTVSHGQAISIGMAVATRLAVSKGLCNSQVADRIIALLHKVGLPVHANKVDLKAARDGLHFIEAVRGRSLNYVVPTGIGSCWILEGISFDMIIEHF